MKTIGINKGLKKMIEENAHDNESVDATLNRLMDLHDAKQKMDDKKTNIVVNDETFDKLVALKLYPTETNISVIYRIISEKGKSKD